MKPRNLFLKIAAGALAAALLASCATTGAAPSDFYAANAKTFTVKTLSNGVKVVMKKNENNRVYDLKLVVDGGSAAVPADKAGVEALGLSLMARGSAKYSYDDIQSIMYEKSASMGGAPGYDYAAFDLVCIDKYFAELSDLFADAVMAPVFDAEEFENAKNDALQASEERFGDPENYGIYVGSQRLFEGHPYASDPAGTMESLQGLTLDDVKAWHAGILDASRISVVAVGNFDQDALVAKLEATIGKIGKNGWKKPAVPQLAVKAGFAKEVHEASEDIAYVQGYYAIPDRDDPDYQAFGLACDMFDDILFGIVREKHGACYSIQAAFRTARTSYGFIRVYKTSTPKEIKSYLDEAVGLMRDGKLIVMKDPATGDAVYATIDERLAAYKNKYINTVYSQQRTSAEMCGSIARSMTYFGDYAEYLRVVEKVRAVKAADVAAAFKKYVVDAPIFWVAVSDEAGLSAFVDADYK